MSRSKEGLNKGENLNRQQQTNEPTENQTNLDERLGARGQTDYTGGRESYREFPRRSTSNRRGEERSYQPREDQETGRYGRRTFNDYDQQSAARYRSKESSPYGTRGELREGTGDVYPRDLANR